MLIKSITLKNFRQYKGEQKIEFSVDPEKNVTVIKGENGAGKTTLLESFLWCFYNKLNLPDKEKLLNLDLINKMNKNDTAELYVEVNLEHNGHDYYIKKTETYMKINNSEVDRMSQNLHIKYKKDDGTLIEINKEEINNILPPDLATYFFFDGERIENLSKSNKDGKKDISNAVKNILGLDIILNAQKHLDKLIKNFEKDYDQDNSIEIKKIKDELAENRNKFSKKQILVDTNNKNIDIVNKQIDELNEKIKLNESSAKLQKIREEKENRIFELQKDIESLEKDIENQNKESLPEFVASKLLRLFSNKFDLSNIESKGITGIDGSAIDSIIERGKCICGEKIIPGSSHYQHLVDQKKFQPPASLGTIILQFNEKTDEIKRKGSEFINAFEDKYIQIETKKDQMENLDKDIENISKELKGAKNVKDLEIEREKKKEELSDLIDKKTEFVSDLKIIEDKIKEQETKLDKVALGNEKNKKIAIRKQYANTVLEKISEYYAKKEKDTREDLNKEVSGIFNKLIETNHLIKINEDYTFKVIDIDGAESTSQGQDVITSFAFIGGLINLAKEKHDNIEVTEPYPLIMDAPFAKLSNAHRNNVAKILPNIVEQFILFTVDSQYEGEIENTIKPSIGKEYELKMYVEDEKYSEVVGV